MPDPVDRALVARFGESMPEQPDSPCPAAEVLWSAVRGELTGDRLEALVAHLRTCGLCGEALALSAELAAQTDATVELPPLTFLRSRRQQMGAAAVAITALAAGLVLTLSQREASPTATAGSSEVIASRGEGADQGAIRSVSPEEQPRTDIRLAWTPVDRALRYRVQVSREDLQ